jgi:hypothetical protein
MRNGILYILQYFRPAQRSGFAKRPPREAQAPWRTRQAWHVALLRACMDRVQKIRNFHAMEALAKLRFARAVFRIQDSE